MSGAAGDAGSRRQRKWPDARHNVGHAVHDDNTLRQAEPDLRSLDCSSVSRCVGHAVHDDNTLV